MNLQLASGAAAVLYLGAALMLAFHVAGRGPARLSASPLPGLATGFAAALAHTLALHSLLFTPAGLDLGFFQAASLVCWQIALVVLIAAARMPVASLGVIVLPLVALAALAPLYFESSSPVAQPDWRLEAHILLSLLAYSLLAVAAVQALILAAQDRQLHARRPGGWIRALPPLEAMERLLFRLIAGGFVLLALAVITGALFIDDMFAQHLVHKTVLSLLSLALFGGLLWGRWRHGWRGRVALRWTLGGFIALALAYFGSKLVLELILGTRWG